MKQRKENTIRQRTKRASTNTEIRNSNTNQYDHNKCEINLDTPRSKNQK